MNVFKNYANYYDWDKDYQKKANGMFNLAQKKQESSWGIYWVSRG